MNLLSPSGKKFHRTNIECRVPYSLHYTTLQYPILDIRIFIVVKLRPPNIGKLKRKAFLWQEKKVIEKKNLDFFRFFFFYFWLFLKKIYFRSFYAFYLFIFFLRGGGWYLIFFVFFLKIFWFLEIFSDFWNFWPYHDNF